MGWPVLFVLFLCGCVGVVCKTYRDEREAARVKEEFIDNLNTTEMGKLKDWLVKVDHQVVHTLGLGVQITQKLLDFSTTHSGEVLIGIISASVPNGAPYTAEVLAIAKSAAAAMANAGDKKWREAVAERALAEIVVLIHPTKMPNGVADWQKIIRDMFAPTA
jgi:hypothetical protein